MRKCLLKLNRISATQPVSHFILKKEALKAVLRRIIGFLIQNKKESPNAAA